MSLVQKLYHAAADGDIRAVRTLLSGSGGSVARLVNGIGRTGYTALLAATQLGHPDIVRVLLAKGADIDAKGKHGFAALYVASRRSHRATDMVRLLLEKGADIEVKDKSTPLHGASQEGNLDVVRLLLEKGAVAGAKDKAERTALHGASGEGHLEVVRLLLEKGVDVGAKDK
ncbi:ankyrin repeat-containing domain protein [Ochromonadaceae sp. CCMP2298]|nr:ankyrin repeat-containing domain protein [Ochromonadaceae sp. CCMP2298]